MGAPMLRSSLAEGINGPASYVTGVLGSCANQFVSAEDAHMCRSTPHILRIEKARDDAPTSVAVNMFWHEEDWA